MSRRGRRQAEALPDLLLPLGAARVLSSPYVRCRQTVDPVAVALGVALEASDDLAEGAGLAALDLARGAGAGAVLCTHGDVTYDLVHLLHRQGVVDRPADTQKGATWVLELAGERVTAARYLPPPA